MPTSVVNIDIMGHHTNGIRQHGHNNNDYIFVGQLQKISLVIIIHLDVTIEFTKKRQSINGQYT